MEDGFGGLNYFFEKVQGTWHNLSIQMETSKALERKGRGTIKLFVSYANVSKEVKNEGCCTLNDLLFHHVSDPTDIIWGGGSIPE
jgi:hypothetical protein